MRQPHPRTESRHDLLGFIRAQQAGVDEYAQQTVTDGPGHERRRDCRVDSPRERADRRPITNGLLNFSDRLLDECRRSPVPGSSANSVQEVAQDFRPTRGVRDLRVELHTESHGSIAHRGDGNRGCASDRAEPSGRSAHRVAVTHPGALARPKTLEYP